MNFSLSDILAGLIFGVFGIYFYKRGKSEGNVYRIVIGVALIGFPYVVSNPWAAWSLGIALMFAGFKMEM